jgi:hypothetical protein
MASGAIASAISKRRERSYTWQLFQESERARSARGIELVGRGPTSLFKLLMGTTHSTRDKLAAASQMVSLFIMDFAPGRVRITISFWPCGRVFRFPG